MNHQNQQIKQLEQLLQQGKDSAFLRFGLANAYWQSDNFANALQHVAQAVRQDPYYSAAWKLYGKVLTQLQRYQQAIEVFQQLKPRKHKAINRPLKRCRCF